MSGVPDSVSRCHGITSARTPRRAIARQRSRPHAKSRRERRRHVVKRGAAIAADFLRRVLHAKPVAARGTFRSQTLHRPTGQILHPVASQSAEFLEVENAPSNRPDCAPESLVCQAKKLLLVGVSLRSGRNRRCLARDFAAAIYLGLTVAVSESGVVVDLGWAGAGCAA
jgi:hypothetical protein